MTTFAEWLPSENIGGEAIAKYKGALKGKLSKLAIAKGISNINILEISDPGKFNSVWRKLKVLPEFIEFDKTGHQMYSSAAKKYLRYLKYLSHEAGSIKDQWVKKIEDLKSKKMLTNLQLELESPQFDYGNWHVGLEHQRNFNSVVLRWLGPLEVTPSCHDSWKVCPENDVKKKWNFRRKLEIDDFEKFLIELQATGFTFEQQLERSSSGSAKDRADRLSKADKIPRIYEVKTQVFDRNPDVVVEVLNRANGICEECKKPAPFDRRSDNTPYLEVHHRELLSQGGEDSVENAIALCPNCHREMHYGV